MRDNWRALLLQISTELSPPVLLEWHISGGILFEMLLPKPSEFLAHAFTPEVEFPFAFEQIQKLRTVVKIPGYALTEEQTTQLLDIVNHHKGFQFTCNAQHQVVITCRA